MEGADDYLANPESGLIVFPFGNEAKESGPDPKSPENKRKSSGKLKYGAGHVPKKISRSMKNKPPLIRLMRNKFWISRLKKMFSASLAKNTWLKYKSVLKLYEKFSDEQGLGENWPDSEEKFLSFSLWCLENRSLSADSLNGYLSALRTMSTIAGLDAPVSSRAQKLLLRGAKNSESKKRRNSDPFTFEALKTARKSLQSRKWAKSNKKVIWACFSAGYFGSFRAGELLLKNKDDFDKSSDLTWKDIKFESDGTAQITVKKSKTGGMQKIDLFAFPEKSLCPVVALKKLKKMQIKKGYFSPSQGVFRFESGKMLTVSNLSKTMKKLFRKTKFRNQLLSAKSLRSGFPTDLENLPETFKDGHIKIWGRWRSNAYQTYMKNDRLQREWVFKKFVEIKCFS